MLFDFKKEFTLLNNYKTLEEHQEQEQEAIEILINTSMK
jgi:hypothetical protein